MELSEEEKKAIDILKEIKDIRGIRQDVEGENEDLYALDIVYNLIDKQQKEIKDWFEIADNILRATNDYGNISIGYIPKYIDKLQKDIEELKKICDSYKNASDNCAEIFSDTIKPNYISKNKIKEKIKALEKEIETNSIYEENWNKIDILEELLEEN